LPVQEGRELPQLVQRVVHVGGIKREAVRRLAEGADDQGEDGAWGFGDEPFQVRGEAVEPAGRFDRAGGSRVVVRGMLVFDGVVVGVQMGCQECLSSRRLRTALA
jgi:hypothetical protein